jgi:hypothetical protein
MNAAQIILAGEDQALDFLSNEELVAHHFRVGQEWLAAHRLQAGWSREAVAEHSVIPFPDADPRELPQLQARLRILDVLVSQRTGQRVRTLTGSPSGRVRSRRWSSRGTAARMDREKLS